VSQLPNHCCWMAPGNPPAFIQKQFHGEHKQQGGNTQSAMTSWLPIGIPRMVVSITYATLCLAKSHMRLVVVASHSIGRQNIEPQVARWRDRNLTPEVLEEFAKVSKPRCPAYMPRRGRASKINSASAPSWLAVAAVAFILCCIVCILYVYINICLYTLQPASCCAMQATQFKQCTVCGITHCSIVSLTFTQPCPVPSHGLFLQELVASPKDRRVARLALAVLRNNTLTPLQWLRGSSMYRRVSLHTWAGCG
jgi:hypothetical protein